MTVEPPWPEHPERVRSRVRGIVDSVLRPEELVDVHVDVVTTDPLLHPAGVPDLRPVLRVNVRVVQDEAFSCDVWGVGWDVDWEGTLDQLASSLEDRVCETSFAWRQQRVATVPH